MKLKDAKFTVFKTWVKELIKEFGISSKLGLLIGGYAAWELYNANADTT